MNKQWLEDLPTEIRLEIYKNYFQGLIVWLYCTLIKSARICFCYYDQACRKLVERQKNHMNLFLVSRQISREAKPVFLQEALFVLRQPQPVAVTRDHFLRQGACNIEYHWSTPNHTRDLNLTKDSCQLCVKPILESIRMRVGFLSFKELDNALDLGLEGAHHIWILMVCRATLEALTIEINKSGSIVITGKVKSAVAIARDHVMAAGALRGFRFVVDTTDNS